MSSLGGRQTAETAERDSESESNEGSMPANASRDSHRSAATIEVAVAETLPPVKPGYICPHCKGVGGAEYRYRHVLFAAFVGGLGAMLVNSFY